MVFVPSRYDVVLDMMMRSIWVFEP
jgi:hypothetical protein